MPDHYTTQAAAERLGLSRRTVQWWARKLGWERDGRDYWITEAQLQELERRKTTPGPEPGTRKERR